MRWDTVVTVGDEVSDGQVTEKVLEMSAPGTLPLWISFCLSLCALSVCLLYCSLTGFVTPVYVREAFFCCTYCVLFPSSVCHLHLDLVFFNFSLYLISSYLMIFVLWLLGYELYFLIFDPKKIYWLFFSVVVCQWHDLYHAFSAAIFPASRYDRFSSSVVCGNKLNWRHFYCLQCLLKCTRKTKTPPYH